MAMLDKVTYDEIVNLIEPLMRDRIAREQHVTYIFTGTGEQLPRIDYDGASRTVTERIVFKLAKYGKLKDTQALWSLLKASISKEVGFVQQQQISAWETLLNVDDLQLHGDIPNPEKPTQTTSIHIGGNVSGAIVNIGGNQTIKGNVTVNQTTVTDDKNDHVRFRLYSPAQGRINTRSGLYVYAYVESLVQQIEADIIRFITELGGSIPKPKTSKKSTNIEHGTLITVVPESSELEFEPASLQKKWHGDWTRFDFEFRPDQESLHETVFVRVSIQIEGVEIANIKCAIDIAEQEINKSVAVNSDNPLALEKMNSQSTAPYQRIFISYSRKDTEIARAYKLAQLALGNDTFLDVDNLRAGENWQAALATAISEADIFQLFWSEDSSMSQYCRYEWEYAIKHRCPDNQCEGFIRPVYWRNPMPAPPNELSHLNFKFVPFKESSE
jgi:hypothetical protein